MRAFSLGAPIRTTIWMAVVVAAGCATLRGHPGHVLDGWPLPAD